MPGTIAGAWGGRGFVIVRLSNRTLYRMFLECDWWRDLSRKKRKKVGKCERCGSHKQLQSHHRRYPDHWFDTREEDLEVLCRECHRLEHPGRAPKRRRKARKPAWKPPILPGLARSYLYRVRFF